jgi:hypothetical protein
MKDARWLLLVFPLALAACGEGGFTEQVPVDPVAGPPVPTGTVTTPGTPPPGKVLFAFKAGLDGDEQIWLWLEGDRLHPVSTWASPDRVSGISRSTAGYVEGSGRFSGLQFDHQRRFLLAAERVSADPQRGPSRRLVAYELATGKTTFISLNEATGTPEGSPLGEVRILASATATLVLVPVSGDVYVGPMSLPVRHSLFEWQDGALVPSASDQPMNLGASSLQALADLAGDPVLLGTGVYRRQQGQWQAVLQGNRPSDSFVNHRVSPAGDVLCLIQYVQQGSLIRLVGADGNTQDLTCQGRARDCAFSPDGNLLYLSGCAQPLIARDGTTRPAPRVRLFGGARAGSGEAAVTLGVVQNENIFMPGPPPPELIAFDWRTLATRPRDSTALRSLGERCRVDEIETPASGAGVGVVGVSCGCIDCDDGLGYALDVQSEQLHAIHAPGGSAFIRGSILLGSAVVTTAVGGNLFDPSSRGSSVFWSDAARTRLLGPLTGVSGVVHGAVAY